MAGLIPQQFIDDLLARTDIVDVIDGYVPLKRAGKNHQACCPFHDEKTPSFTVSQQKQFYHCFGCGANGSAIGFLMEYMNMGFVEAVEELASRAGMEIPKEAINSRVNPDTSELYELMELVNKFYLKQLRQHSEAGRVIDYLKGRGISGAIAARYELGFAPPGWDNLIAELGRSDAGIKRLQKTGAIIEKDNGGYYDRFRDRLMFPIRDQRGRVIGFGGRVLEADAKPKYLNSPETPIFQKGQELYGLYQARKNLKDTDCVYVVEGYMDVIALAQHGINNAVASLGTAATSEHIDKLFRHSGKLVFCFDGDEAGKKAAWRALENALPMLKEGRQVHFTFLPDGEDPDSFVRDKGKAAFEDKDLQQPLSEFLFRSLRHGIDLGTPEGCALMIEKALPLLGLLPGGALKNILIQELATLTHYDAKVLEDQLEHRPDRGQPVRNRIKPAQSNKGVEKVRWLVRALLHQPELANELDSTANLAVFTSPGITFLVELIEFIKERPHITTASILEHWRDTRFEQRLRELAGESETVTEIGVTGAEFMEAIERLIKTNIREFELFKLKNRPSELSEEEKQHYRDMQRTEPETDSKA